MAKLEHKAGSAAAKTQKAKKRKHTSPENDEEVASKSLILEPTEPAATKGVPKAEITTTKTLKRKNPEKSKIKEKRSKQMADEVDSEAASDAEEPPLYEPTPAELQACEKPENVSAVVTVRQKEKEKHQQRLEVHKDETEDREKNRCEEYLRKWKNARSEWKFQKRRQIAIQQSMFDDQKISAEMWPITLEYLSGSKGAAKDKIAKLAEECIDQLDKQCAQQDSDDARQSIIDSTKYQRARDLLQSFD